MNYSNSIPYKLRQRSQFKIPLVHSVFNGTENFRFLGLKIWALALNEMKQKSRNAIKQWKPTFCSCRLCKRYIHGIGFFDKILLRNDHVFFYFFVFLFYFISFYEVRFQLLCKFLLVRWP